MASAADALSMPLGTRLDELGLAEQTDSTLTLTERGRYLGGAVTVELLA